MLKVGEMGWNNGRIREKVSKESMCRNEIDKKCRKIGKWIEEE
jgi:hypothetical protein